jgi:hypothetical protein
MKSEDDFALLSREINQLSSILHASEQSCFAGFTIGPYFEGEKLTVHAFNPRGNLGDPKLLKPPPSAARRLKNLLQEAINAKADKKDTEGKRPYIIVLDLSWHPLVCDTDAWSMFDEFGDHHFDMLHNVDGVLLIEADFNQHRMGRRSVILPDESHSAYAKDAIAILNRLSPPRPRL